MNFLVLTMMLTHSLYAKEMAVYSCAVDKDIKVELSLIDSKNPTVSLINKNAKFGLCFFETLPSSKPFDKKTATNESLWQLKLKKCDYYSEKLKTKLIIEEAISFKQSHGKTPGYLAILKDQQPLFCSPKT